jgi:HAD superfamily hydrolase (TIGR01509 family)
MTALHLAPRAVLFDLDGLILDTEAIVWEIMPVVAAQFGVSLERTLFLELIGRHGPDVEDRLLAAWGRDFPLEDFKRGTQAAWRAYTDSKPIPVKPGLDALIACLDRRGIKRAIATSTRHARALHKLDCAGLAGRFDTVIGGDMVREGKPAPDIYLLAAERLGVAATECVVLEDSEPGARAGLAAGATVLLIPDMKPPSDELKTLVHAVLPSLDHAMELIEAAHAAVHPAEAASRQR